MWHKLQEIEMIQNLMEKDMFHRALWMRNYKQGKIAIWLLWAMSFWLLPIIYLSSANMMVDWLGVNLEYSYHFDYGFTLFVLGGLLIILACILIGLEKTNHGMDFTFTLPFKRRDIFLAKWMMGAANITAITIVNMIFMFFIQKTTIHGAYQTFTPFLIFFLFMFIALLAIYSLALFIGTITGGFISQAFVTIGIYIFPYLLWALLIPFFEHHYISTQWLWDLENLFINISVIPSIITPYFSFFEQRIGGTVTLHQVLPSLIAWISLLLYLFTSLHFGMHFYQQTSSENNGKFIIFKKLEPLIFWLLVVCTALFGGAIGADLLWHGRFSNFIWSPLFAYYISFIISSVISYIILTKLMQKPLKPRKS